MREKKKVLISILIFAIYVSLAVQIFAAEGSAIDILGNIPTVNNTTTVNNISNNIVNNTPATIINTNLNTTKTNVSNSNVNNTSNLPNTGLDSTIVFVIIAFGVSAIYAYNKIKDYNIK